MEFSKYNIISGIAGSDEYFIVNQLSKQADLLSAIQYTALKNGNYPDPQELISKGYLINPVEEEKLFRKKYLEFLDNRDSDEIQLFFVPGYTCNFNCSYCYQNEYLAENQKPGIEVIASFFNYIDHQFAGRRKYITAFGGEPLLNTKWHRQVLESLIEGSTRRNLDLAIVTNGYYLVEYTDLLKAASVREIQITLDGLEKLHNLRRPLKGGGPTFSQIVKGIDTSLELGFPVNLRMVLDKQNINELPKLARFAIDKGWTELKHFKTQLGRNYELHHCQSDTNNLYTRIEMYRDIYDMIKKYPEIMKFHQPAFSVSKFLFKEGDLPEPLFDSCPATKTEWAFDYTGKIYSCTATVGKVGEELGTFYPDIKLDVERIAEWESRDLHAEAFDMTYAWTWHNAVHNLVHGQADLNSLFVYYSWNEKAYPHNCYRMTFVSNHDKNSWEGTQFELFGEGLEAAIVLSMVGEGLPLIYNGDEAGNPKRLAFFEKDPIDWQDHPIGGLYKRLVALKKHNTALWNGSAGARMIHVPNSVPDRVFSFVRQNEQDKVFTVINFSENYHQVIFYEKLFHGVYTDYISGQQTFSLILRHNIYFDH